MGFFSKFKDTRKPEMVNDFDKINASVITFRLHGKTHKLAPLTAYQFFDFLQKYSEMMALKDRNSIDGKELIDRYYNLISSICPSITRADIEKSSQQQVVALFSLIMKTVTGERIDEEKIEDGVKKK